MTGKKNLVRQSKIIAGDTGELISIKESVGVNRFDADKGYLFRTGKSGNTITCCVNNLPATLSDADVGKLLRLSAALAADKNCLVYRSGNVTKPMQTEHIAKMLNLSERSCQRFISRMTDQRVMTKVYVKQLSPSGDDMRFREVRLFVNPSFLLSGNWISRDLYFLFKQDLDKILPAWVLRKFNN